MITSIVVGDRITFIDGKQILVTEERDYDINTIKRIERIGCNGWETICEQKGILTSDERIMIKALVDNVNKFGSKKVKELFIFDETVDGINNVVFSFLNDTQIISNLRTCEEFPNLERDRKYTLKDLGIFDN